VGRRAGAAELADVAISGGAMADEHAIHLLPDVWNGAVRGDYAPRLGVAGAATQAVISYVPLVGTLCALRDYFACRRKHDALGAGLNLVAIVPVLGGFPKTVEVIHHFATLNTALKATRVGKGYAVVEPPVEPHVANPLAGLSLLLAAVTPILLVLPGSWVLLALAAPLCAIVAGYLALGRARHHPEAHAHRGTARLALVIAYFYLLVMAITIGILLWTGHSVGPFSLPAHG
jgi:hypothetical protein